jgi:hypothetical protein
MAERGADWFFGPYAVEHQGEQNMARAGASSRSLQTNGEDICGRLHSRTVLSSVYRV